MKIDLHNHTALCNHAEGTMEEFVLRAIEKGLDVFGFADHGPMEEFDPEYRMTFAQRDGYEAEVLRLKAKYADKIEILLGYEVDYIEGAMDHDLLQADVDYLIGSVHYLDKWGFDNPQFMDGYEGRDADETWTAYFKIMADMARSGLFDIVAHLDLLKIFKFLPQTDILELAAPALEAIAESSMAIEINASGYRKPIAEPYPSEKLLIEANRLGIPITFSSDAHKVEQIGFRRKDTVALAKKCGFTQCALWRKRKMEMVEF